MSTAATDRPVDPMPERDRALAAFLDAEQDRLARACLDMARALHQGGALVPFGAAAAASSGAAGPAGARGRALPATAQEGTAGDVALASAHERDDAGARAFVASAAARGMLTIALAAEPIDADHAFVVDGDDPAIVREVQLTACRLLRELVQVFFDHPDTLQDACITCGDIAVEAEVVEVAGHTATVRRGSCTEQVAVDLVDGVQAGDRLLCHAGIALERLAPGPPVLAEDGADELEGVLARVRASMVREGRGAIALEPLR